MRIPRAIWFDVGRDGERYPDAVRELEGRSGAYVIRCGKTIVYVGESHTGRLRSTMVRHFQRWRRSSGKTFWERLYGRRNDPGTTYERARCTVAVFFTAPSHAVDLEAELIRRFKPRDNLATYASTYVEGVPF